MIWVWFMNNSFFNWTALPRFVFFLLFTRNSEKSLPVSVANLSNPLCWLGDLTYINTLTYDFFIEHLSKKFWLEKPKQQGLTSGKKRFGHKINVCFKADFGSEADKGWMSRLCCGSLIIFKWLEWKQTEEHVMLSIKSKLKKIHMLPFVALSTVLCLNL